MSRLTTGPAARIERSERVLRKSHRRVMRRVTASIAALDSVAPGEFLRDRPDVQVANRLSDQAYATARALRRRVWGPWATGPFA